MSHQKRRDFVAKNMQKFSHGEAHKSKKDYKRKSKYKDNSYDFKDKESYQAY